MDFLLERYTLRRDRVNALANRFIQDWCLAIEKYADENMDSFPVAFLPKSLRNIKTQFDKIYWYFTMMFDNDYKNIRTYKKTYNTDKGEVVMKLGIRRQSSRVPYGYIISGVDEKTGKLKPTINIFVSTYLTNQLALSVEQYPQLDYNFLRDFIQSVKKTTAHELTHYYQFTRKAFDNTIYHSSKNMYGEYTNFLTLFRYMTQDSEAESFVSEGYKLYKEKYNDKSLCTCIITSLLDLIDVNLSKDFYDGYINLRDVLEEIKPHEKFLILWFLYVFIPENFKQSALFKFQDECLEEIQDMVKPNILKRNRQNILKFLDLITKNDLEKELNNYIRKETRAGREHDLQSDLFPITTSNKKYIDSLA